MERNLLGGPISSAEQLRIELRAALQGVREEFDDHLDSINANTSEIQSNFEYLCRMDSKIDKLSEQIENIQHWLTRNTGMPVQDDDIKEIQLSKEEKDVFFVIYTATNERPVTYHDIAKALDQSEFLVRSYITNLVEKGVPIVKHYIQNAAYLSLDPRFKELQMKRNILGISQTTVDSFQ